MKPTYNSPDELEQAMLRELGACREGLHWIRERRYTSISDVWSHVDSAGWMLWFLWALDGKRMTSRWRVAASICLRYALEQVARCDDLNDCLRALETGKGMHVARAEAVDIASIADDDDDDTLEDLAHAMVVALSSDAQVMGLDVEDAAEDAAHALNHETGVSITSVMKYMADLIRREIPTVL